MSDTPCHETQPHAPHAWGDLEWCPGPQVEGVAEVAHHYAQGSDEGNAYSRGWHNGYDAGWDAARRSSRDAAARGPR